MLVSTLNEMTTWLIPSHRQSLLTSRLMHMEQYTSRLSEAGLKQSVDFPQLPESPFLEIQVATRGKLTGCLQFFISQYKQDDIGL